MPERRIRKHLSSSLVVVVVVVVGVPREKIDFCEFVNVSTK